MKSLGDAIALRNRLIGNLEEADFECNAAERAPLLTVVVAGGGFAGVETIAAVNDFLREAIHFYPNLNARWLRMVLVHSGPRILPELGDSLGAYAERKLAARGVEILLGRRAAEVTDQGVRLSDGAAIATRTLVWTAGTSVHPLIEALPCARERGRVRVDGFMEVPEWPGVWAVGDCAAIPDAATGSVCPPTAQHALRQGRVVARNIVAALNGGRKQAFRYASLGQLAAIGRRTGVARVLGVQFSGFAAWWMWRTIYLSKLPRFEKKLRVALDWFLDILFSKDLVQFRTLRAPTISHAESGTPPAQRAGRSRRQPQGESTALTGTALHGDAAAVGLGDVADEGQAHTAAAAALGLAPAEAIKLVEDPRVLLAWDAHARVGDGDGQLAVRQAGVDGQRLPLGRVLDRVVDQVGESLPDGVGVERDLRQIGRDPEVDLEALLGQRIAERFQRVPDERLHGGGHPVIGAPAALDAREVEHVVDQARQPLAFPRDHPVVLMPRGFVRQAPHLQGLAEHPDHRQWRLEVVGDVGNEVGLEPCHLRLPPDQTVRGHDAGDDDQEQHAEGGREDRDLAADGFAGRRAARLVEGQAPVGKPLAERDRDEQVGLLEGSLAEHGPALGVEHGADDRRLQGLDDGLEHVALEILQARRESGQPRGAAAGLDEASEHRALTGKELATAAALPQALGDPRDGCGDGAGVRRGGAGVEQPNAAVRQVQALDQRRPGAEAGERGGAVARLPERLL